MTTMTAADSVNLADPEDIFDAMLNRAPLAFPGDDTPWEMYKALRDQAPILKSERNGMWVFTRYRDVLKALRHPHMDLGFRQRKDAEAGIVSAEVVAPTMLYFKDPKDTMRQRRLMRPAFTREAVQRRAFEVEAIVDRLVDKCAEMGSFDFFADFADNLPVSVMCQLLGVPSEDVPIFRDWTRTAAPATGVELRDEEIARQIDEAFRGLRDYMSALLDERRKNPGEHDLLSVMIKAADNEDELSNEELVGLSIFVLTAGSDTTTQLMTSAVNTLSRFPEQERKLRENRDLMPEAIEELIRHSGPVHYAQPRMLTEPMEVDGHQIEPGEIIFSSVGGANRDPDQFPNPDEIDFDRRDIRHLGFSQGLHLCIGAMLARLEANIGIERFLDRFAAYEVEDERIEYVDFYPMRGIRALHLSTTLA